MTDTPESDPKPSPLFKLIETYKTQKDVHNVFGLILYTKGDPYVIKVLRDQDFWNALDQDSGKRWPIFSLRPKQGTYHKGVRPEFLVDLSASKGHWEEPFDNYELLGALQLDSTIGLPVLLIFAAGPEGEVMCASFDIRGESADASYKSLSEAINRIADAIKDVTPENVKNTEEIYNLMANALMQHIWFSRVKTALSFAQWVKSVFSLFS